MYNQGLLIQLQMWITTFLGDQVIHSYMHLKLIMIICTYKQMVTKLATFPNL